MKAPCVQRGELKLNKVTEEHMHVEPCTCMIRVDRVCLVACSAENCHSKFAGPILSSCF